MMKYKLKKEEIKKMLNPYCQTEWRQLGKPDKNGISHSYDKEIIRNIIAALNYNYPNDKNVAKTIEKARPKWENNENEPIPDPIPHPDIVKE